MSWGSWAKTTTTSGSFVGERGAARPAFGLKTVGAFIPRLTRKAFEKHGFPAATLITNWKAIIGPDLSRFTRPERLKWPRRHSVLDEDREDAVQADSRTAGATLVLRVEGPRAIEVQFKSAQIIERINTYFGYRAVTEIRILQAPLPQKQEKAQLFKEDRSPQEHPQIEGIQNIELRKALERLAEGVKARKHKSG